jgi:hypothetical protein
MRALGGLPVSTCCWTVDAGERPTVKLAMTVNSIAIGASVTS